MELSFRPLLHSLLVTLFAVTPLACEDNAPVESTGGYIIERDPKLGKPLLSLKSPPKDADGRRGDDILEQFLIYVRNDDVDSAKQLCRFSVIASRSSGSIGRVSKYDLPGDTEYAQRALAEIADSEALFPSFVEKLQRATKYTIGATVKQKSIYWTISIAADGVEKQPWGGTVYLCYESNTWKIIVDDLTPNHRLQLNGDARE